MIEEILNGKMEDTKKKLSQGFRIKAISYIQKKLNEGFKIAIQSIRNEGREIRRKNYKSSKSPSLLSGEGLRGGDMPRPWLKSKVR